MRGTSDEAGQRMQVAEHRLRQWLIAAAVYVICLGFAVACGLSLANAQSSFVGEGSGDIGPKAYPLIAIAILGLASLACLVRAPRETLAGLPRPSFYSTAVIGSVIVFPVLFTVDAFVAMVAAYLLGVWAMKARRPTVPEITISVAVCLAILALISYGLSRSLPTIVPI